MWGHNRALDGWHEPSVGAILEDYCSGRREVLVKMTWIVTAETATLLSVYGVLILRAILGTPDQGWLNVSKPSTTQNTVKSDY